MMALLLRLVGFLNLFLFGIATLLTLLIVVPTQLILLLLDPDRRVASALGRWTWGIGMFGMQPFWRVTITGRERLAKAKPGQGWIIVANHQSMLDIPLLMMLPLQLRLLARTTLIKMPVFGQMAWFGGHVFVDPDHPEKTLAQCQRYLDQGISIAIFPEGTRGDGDTLLPFARGAFELALQTQAPILPACIHGTARALPKGSPFTQDFLCPFHLALLPPIYPEPGSSPAIRRKLATQIRQQIETTLHGPHPYPLSHRLKSQYPGWRGGFAFGKTLWDPVFWALWERLPRTGQLLDVGCGEGFLGMYLKNAGSGIEITGIDHDQARIQSAQKASIGSSGLGFMVADARSFITSNQYFDAITVIDVLHYLEPTEQDTLLAQLCERLAPNGQLFVRDPEPDQGITSLITRTSEQVFVLMGRHKGDQVRVRGGSAIAQSMSRFLVDIQQEDCSGTGFSNTLIRGRAPASADTP